MPVTSEPLESFSAGFEEYQKVWYDALVLYNSKKRPRSCSTPIAPPPKRSRLGRGLLKCWCWQGLSATALRQTAEHSVEDGLNHEDLKHMAGLGSHGAHEGNIHTELCNWLSSFIKAAYPFRMAPMPMLLDTTEGSKPCMVDTAFCFAHDTMRFLWNNHRDIFMKKFVGEPGAVANYWKSIRGDDPRRQRNPHFANPLLYEFGLPVAIHGDGVSLGGHHCRSSFKSLAFEGGLGDRCGDTTDNIHFLSGYFSDAEVLKAHKFKQGTTKDVWYQRIVWSLLAAESGREPHKDWDNVPFAKGTVDHGRRGNHICGGYFLVPMLAKADTEWHISHFGLPGHWTSHHPCRGCPATRAKGSAKNSLFKT